MLFPTLSALTDPPMSPTQVIEINMFMMGMSRKWCKLAGRNG